MGIISFEMDKDELRKHEKLSWVPGLEGKGMNMSKSSTPWQEAGTEASYFIAFL